MSVLGLLAVTFGGYLVAYRKALLLYSRLLAWLKPPTGLEHDEHGFPHREVDLTKELAACPPGMLFVGLTPQKRRYLPGWTYRRLYLSAPTSPITRDEVIGR